MDDMTFVYYEDPNKESPPYHELQLVFIQNETSNNLVKVTSRELARLLKLEHGTFHCYYKPSFANYDHEHRLLT